MATGRMFLVRMFLVGRLEDGSNNGSNNTTIRSTTELNDIKPFYLLAESAKQIVSLNPETLEEINNEDFHQKYNSLNGFFNIQNKEGGNEMWLEVNNMCHVINPRIDIRIEKFNISYYKKILLKENSPINSKIKKDNMLYDVFLQKIKTNIDDNMDILDTFTKIAILQKYKSDKEIFLLR